MPPAIAVALPSRGLGLPPAGIRHAAAAGAECLSCALQARAGLPPRERRHAAPQWRGAPSFATPLPDGWWSPQLRTLSRQKSMIVIQVRTAPQRRGFSGTAVWDEVLGGVIGMVVAADPDPASKTAYLVPTDVLAEVWPALNVVRPRAMIVAPRVVGERVSAAVDVFRDRVEFRARLRGLVLAREKPIICVTGRSGIGKSGLVARVLADFEEAANMTQDQVGGLAYLSTRTGVGVLDLARIFHAHPPPAAGRGGPSRGAVGQRRGRGAA